MTDHPSALVSVPQAHIVWNEARNEGVIFVDQETTGWPLTAADDAYQASTGKSRHPGLGSALAEAFYDGYEDDEDRPVQVVPASIFAPAAPQAAVVGEDEWSELERLADAATQGPWKACGTIYEHMNCEVRGGAKGDAK